MLDVLNVQLRTVNITALRDGIFYADLVFSNGAEVSARPSDSIALALRTGASIFAAEEILDEAGVAIPDEQEERGREVPGVSGHHLPGRLRPRHLNGHCTFTQPRSGTLLPQVAKSGYTAGERSPRPGMPDLNGMSRRAVWDR